MCISPQDPVYFKMFLFSSVIAFSIDLGPVMVYWFDDVAKYSKGFQGSIATVSYVVALLMIVMQVRPPAHPPGPAGPAGPTH